MIFLNYSQSIYCRKYCDFYHLFLQPLATLPAVRWPHTLRVPRTRRRGRTRQKLIGHGHGHGPPPPNHPITLTSIHTTQLTFSLPKLHHISPSFWHFGLQFVFLEYRCTLFAFFYSCPHVISLNIASRHHAQGRPQGQARRASRPAQVWQEGL